MKAPCLTLVAVLAAGPALGAQEVTAGGYFESYSFAEADAVGIDALSLVTLPFSVAAAPTPRLRLSLAGAYARGSLESGGATTTLSGLIDTAIRATYTLGNDAVAVSGGVILPTGKGSQTGDEAIVAGAIGSDLLPSRVSNWGTGGGFELSAAWAGRVGALGVGASTGLRVFPEYEPLAASGPDVLDLTYDPGDEAFVRLAVDGNTSAGGKVSVSATLQNFTNDVSEGVDLFAAGPRVQVLGSYAFPWQGRGSGFLYGGLLHRSAGEFLDGGVGETASQNVLLAGVGSRMQLGTRYLRPTLDARVLNRSDGLGQGYTLGAGATLETQAGASATAFPTVRVRYGSLEASEGRSSSFFGFDVGLAVRFGGDR